MWNKLSLKIIIIVSLILLLSMFLTGVYFIRSERDFLFKKAFSEASRINKNIEDFLRILMVIGLPEPDSILTKAMIEQKQSDVIEIKLVHTPNLGDAFLDKKIGEKYKFERVSTPKNEIESRVMSGETVAERIVVNLRGKSLRAIRYVSPIKADESCFACHEVKQGEIMGAFFSVISLEDIYQVVRRRTIGIALLFGLGFIFILIALYVSLRKMVLRPIVKISQAVGRIIEKQDLSQKVEVVSSDEIGQLGIVFNKMFGDLGKYQHELTAAKDYANSIITNMLDALVVIDPEGKIMTVNNAATGLLGYQENELIGKPAALIFEEEDEETILNRVDAPAILISRDFKILEANDAFMELLGAARKDIVGEFCYKVTHNRTSICEPPHDNCPAKEAIEKNKPCVELHTHFDQQGNPYLVNVVVAPIMDSAGSILYYLHLTKDIKDDRQKHLGRQEVLDVASKLAEQLKEILRGAEEELDKAHVFTKSGLRRLIKAGVVRDVEMNYRSKRGELIPVSFSGSLMRDKKGELIGIVGVAKDMRETKRLMLREKEAAVAKAEAGVERKRAKDLGEAYRQLQDLQDTLIQAEKLNAIGRLASGVAHEVKNPLGIIRQSAEYLQNKLLPSEKNAPEALEMIKKNVKRADDIIRLLLDFSRVSKLERKTESINSILESSLALIQHSPMLENIKIVRQLGENLPACLMDRNKMEQVFINILLNAVQAMPGGGNLFLRTYQVKLNESKNGVGSRSGDFFRVGEDALIVEIEDMGMGISPENLKKVFDPFFTTKDPGQGTGLGMSVTKNILTMHKGLIEIESVEGKGSKVIVTLKI